MSASHLQRKLGIWACVSIVAGSIIGSGIFMKPATMAGQLGSPLLLLLVWIVGGVVSIFGGMINSEIGSMLPVTGGQYAYFRVMYGRFFAYMYGWASFTVINTAAIAAIAFIFAEYSGYFVHLPRFAAGTEQSFVVYVPFIGELFPLEKIGVKLLAITLILVFSAVNHRSVKAGGAIQVVFTIIKVAALLFLICGIFFFGNGDVKNLVTPAKDMTDSTLSMVLGSVAAMSGALAAYDGWNNLGFAGGEIKNPQRNIPSGLIWGLIVCMLLYVLTTEAYLFMMPIEEMRSSQLLATDALSKVMGVGGGSIIAILVIVSTAGATNGNILPCSRITYAMAEDGVFFPAAARVSRRYCTPFISIWMQSVWACVFVITGSFDMLMDLFVFVTWIFYGIAGYGIFVLRRKMPEAERPFKLSAYPLVPIIFISFAAFYFVFTVYNDINSYLKGESRVVYSVLGLTLLAAGIPFYFYFLRINRNKPPKLEKFSEDQIT